MTSWQQLASVPDSPGLGSGTPSGEDEITVHRLTDTTITAGTATIDHARFGYWLECRIEGPSLYVGIYGADVTYTISSANG